MKEKKVYETKPLVSLTLPANSQIQLQTGLTYFPLPLLSCSAC